MQNVQFVLPGLGDHRLRAIAMALSAKAQSELAIVTTAWGDFLVRDIDSA